MKPSAVIKAATVVAFVLGMVFTVWAVLVEPTLTFTQRLAILAFLSLVVGVLLPSALTVMDE